MRIIPNFNGKTGVVPRTCAVTNRGTDPEGFIDAGNILAGWDREVYISIAAVKEMGRMVGMYDQGAVKDLEERLIALEREYAEAAELAERLLAAHEAEESAEQIKNELKQKVAA